MTNASAEVMSSGTVRCVRRLSEDGSVVVFKGQLTDPTTQIAFRKVWSRHFSLNLMASLGIRADESVRDHLTIREGDFVSVGEEIARRGDRRGRSLTAKKSGRFLGISSNRLIFETDPYDIESVSAGFPGVVTDIIPNRGAYLETTGGFIQGIWGNGKIGQGILLSIDMDRDRGIFDLDSISMDLAGTVVFANTCLEPNVLKAAARMSPGGLIFGSLPSALLATAEKMPFPIIVTDWLGAGRLSDPVSLTLAENIIKFAYLYAAIPGSGLAGRPEIIIPQDEYIPEKKNPLKTLTIGSQVRIVEGFYGGELGIVTEIISGTSERSDSLESGSDQVRITIDEATQITLPVNNIEVINVK